MKQVIEDALPRDAAAAILAWQRRGNIALALAAVALFFALAGAAWIVHTKNVEAERNAEVLHTSQVEGCIRGNATRTILRDQYRDEISRSRAISPSLFPDIPRDEFRRLTRASIAIDQRAVSHLRPIDCASAYPSPE